MTKNMQKFLKAFPERKKKPLDYRLGWHGQKGSTKRWFPEYSIAFPEHIVSPLNANKSLPNIIPKFREHFCEFLDVKLFEWNERNCFTEQVLLEQYEAPAAPILESDPERHVDVLNRLTRHGIHPALQKKWLKANPELQSPGGKRCLTGHTGAFDTYALTILEKLDRFWSQVSEETEKIAIAYRDKIDGERRKIRDKKEADRIAGIEIYKKYMEVCKKRKAALSERQQWLRAWRERNSDLFITDWLHGKKRREIYKEGENNDARVRALVKHIKTSSVKCYWCDKYLKNGGTVDHITPISKGGKHECYNIVPACPRCNADKSDILPDSPDMPVGNHFEMSFI